MKTISIQAVEGDDGILHKDLILSELIELGFNPEVKEHFDDGRYVNFYIDTDDLKVVWERIKSNILPKSKISQSCMIICHGQNGWDDFLILHDRDPETKLDKL